MQKPIIFSFFSGSGFLDLGFEKTGFDIRFVNDNHQPFIDAYAYSRQAMGIASPQYGHKVCNIEYFNSDEGRRELNELTSKAKQDALVGFIGGPPCPDFSVGGKNKGKDGENGRLTEVYVETILQQRPDFFVFENVKGLWRTKRHRQFYDEMKARLQNANYVLTDRLTNCIEYGAPQDRDRILLFGIQKKLLKPEGSGLDAGFPWDKYVVYNRSSVLNKDVWPSQEVYEAGSQKPQPTYINGYLPLTVEYWFQKNDVNNHPNAKHHFTPRAGLAKFKVIPEGDDSKKSYKRLHRWRYSPTAAYGNNEVHLHPYQDRRLSAAEALAIQSLPKEFCLPDNMSLSNMFKTIGNGVPYLASVGLAQTILTFLRSPAMQAN